MPDRPTPGALETRAATDAATPTLEGRRLRGVIPYGVESRDLGGWREVMEPGCLRGARMDDLVATVDHAGVPIGRHPRTLNLEDGATQLRWSVELPESRSDVREAVERGDLAAASWRMIVKRDEWRGNVRHVHEVAELRDVAVVTAPAYPEARAELRAAPDAPAEPADDTPNEEEATVPEDTTAATATAALTVEDRAAAPPDDRTVEARVIDAIRDVQKGESRALTVATSEPITPPELSTMLFETLKPSAIALASGMNVHSTDRREVVFPRVTSDVDPSWVAPGEVIPEGTPALAALSAEPKKLAHRCEVENEVLDDSVPSVQELLNRHLGVMLGLKLDRSIFEGNPTADPESIRGLKFLTGTQEIVVGSGNGDVLGNYDVFIRAVGMLRAANVPGPYAIAANPRTLTDLELLKEESGSSKQLGAPAGLPPFYVSSQLSTAETTGTSTDTTSAYVYAPGQFWLINRLAGEILLDRSRLFHMDMSEIRAKLRVDFVAPNPVACVRIRGIRPAV